jgi:hypothetical protein
LTAAMLVDSSNLISRQHERQRGAPGRRFTRASKTSRPGFDCAIERPGVDSGGGLHGLSCELMVASAQPPGSRARRLPTGFPESGHCRRTDGAKPKLFRPCDVRLSTECRPALDARRTTRWLSRIQWNA